MGTITGPSFSLFDDPDNDFAALSESEDEEELEVPEEPRLDDFDIFVMLAERRAGPPTSASFAAFPPFLFYVYKVAAFLKKQSIECKAPSVPRILC
jgi:hypothetical protein